MEKETQYFTHDFNARNEDKILCMRRRFKLEGYGMFWAIVEMLNESEDKRLSLKRLDAVAMQLNCKTEKVDKFITACSEDPINLFIKNGEYFYSDSVMKRANIRKEKKEKKIYAAKKRWENESESNETMQTHSGADATHKHSKAGAMQNDANKLNKLNKDTVGISLFKFIKEYEQLDLDTQIKKLCNIWEIKGFKFKETEHLMKLIETYGLKDVWFAFVKSKEMSKVKTGVTNIRYVEGILKRKNKNKNLNNQKGTSQ